MNTISKADLKVLTDRREGWCVSIFLPTHRAGPDVQQDPIRFKNLVREAGERLSTAGVRAPDVEALLAPLVQLLNDISFWQHQGDGLAVFRAEDLLRVYRVPLKLPEVAVVADSFHVKPLLPLLSGDGHFYLLALSQNEVRLFLGTQYGVDQIELSGVPLSLDDALKYDDPERQLQFHTGAPAAGGRRAAMFHGHGTGIDDAKTNILRFFQLVDGGLRAVLRSERAPLVLAGVEYLLPLYREATGYPYVVEGGITGNPEGVSADALHAQAWPIVQPLFQRAQDEAAGQYRQLAGTGQASSVLAEIAAAAFYGRVQTLFVAVGVQRWGAVDPSTHAVEMHDEAVASDEDVLNVLAILTLRHGGTVYAVDPAAVPEAGQGAVAAAIYRY
jgi:hypothetical protein